MAKGGGKNAILLIIAVAAIGGAIYSLSTMKKENPQLDQWIYFVDPQSIQSDTQITAKIKLSELKDYQTKPLVSDPEAEERLVKAGVCGHCGKFFELVGHGEMPEKCAVCKQSLEGFDMHGHKAGG